MPQVIRALFLSFLLVAHSLAGEAKAPVKQGGGWPAAACSRVVGSPERTLEDYLELLKARSGE